MPGLRDYGAAAVCGLVGDLPGVSTEYHGEEGEDMTRFERLEEQEDEYWLARATEQPRTVFMRLPLKLDAPTRPTRVWTRRMQEIADGDRDVS